MMIIGKLMFNTDTNNVVLQYFNRDAGDAPARTGDLFFYLGLTGDPKAADRFQAALDYLSVPGKPGDYVRYPETYNNPKDFTRDQRMQMILGMAATGKRSEIEQSLWADTKRFFRTPDGNFLTPGSFGTYNRAMWASSNSLPVTLRRATDILQIISYPLMFLLDIDLVINSLLICFLKGREPGKIRRFLADKLGMFFMVQDYPKSVSPNNPDAWSVHGAKNVGDDILHVLNLLAAKRWLPTPVSWLARKIYNKFRPTYDLDHKIIAINYDTGELSVIVDGKCSRDSGAQYAFDVYFMPSSYANPFDILFRDIIKKELVG